MTTIPTISELASNLQASIETKMENNIPSFGKNFLRVFCLVFAAVLKMFYLTLGKVQKNIWIDTADPEDQGGTLERFGRIKLNRNPSPARAGLYTVNVTGTVGSIIPAKTTFKTNDDALNPGKLFVLDIAYTLLTSPDSITLRALEAGTDSKLLVDDQLTATAPIAGVNRITTVDAESVAPLAAEDIEDYRTKGIDAYRLEPNGGAMADFRLWSKDAQGVKQAYPYATTGQTAEVDLYIEATIADSDDGKGTPGAAILAEVEAVVEQDPDITKPDDDRGRRPMGVFLVHYLPVTIREIDIEIADFVGATPALQTAIYNALKAMIDSVRPFIAGADVLANKNDILDTNKIISVILTVKPGATFGTVTLLVDGISNNSFTFTNGDIPYLDDVSYT